MSIIRFDPFADLLTNGRWVPAVDIFENGKQELVLKAELPDMKREDIQVVFENNTLTLKGERKFERRREAGAVPPRRARVWHVQPVVLAAVDRGRDEDRRRIQERRADRDAAVPRGSEAADDQRRSRGVRRTSVG